MFSTTALLQGVSVWSVNSESRTEVVYLVTDARLRTYPGLTWSESDATTVQRINHPSRIIEKGVTNL